MASSKRLKKRQMKEDQLVTTTVRLSQFVQDHFTQVISGVIILVAAIGVILFTANVRRNASVGAEAEFGVAMNAYKYTDQAAAAASFRSVADRYGSHKVGILALYFLGECYLSQFMYDEAIIAFDRYIEKTEAEGEFLVAARFARALCYEGRENYAEGAKALEALAQDMNKEDPRYIDVCFEAGRLFELVGDRRAEEYFEIVVDRGAGPVRERSKIWLAILR
ncbi:MAG: tetratricopeptide repeat protein [bacterium]|nr:tetratricopeptide repeat protein [bacterium]